MSETAVALLPEKAAKKVNPKPKKHEVIAALLKLKVEEHKAEFEARQKVADEKRKAVEDDILKLYKDSPDAFELKASWCSWHGLEIKVEATTKKSKHVEKLIAEFNEAQQKVSNIGYLNDRTVQHYRKQITEYVNGGTGSDRVGLMLATPEIKKALQAALDKMNNANAVEA